MIERGAIASAVLAVLLSSLTAFTAHGQPQSRAQQACLNRLNKAGANVGKQQAKENSACLRDAGNGKLSGTAQDCLTADLEGRVQKKKDKTVAEHAKYCTSLPTFGYTSPAIVNQFSQQARLDLLADVFGANLDAAVIDCDANKKACMCQQKVARAVDKVAVKKVAEFLKCKKASLDAGAASIAALEDCVRDPATPGSIAADSKGMIAKAVDGLLKRITNDCDQEGVTNGSFPGNCDGLNGAALASCLDAQVECRVCQMINDIDAAFANCDLFDDGSANASCASGAGPTPTPTATPTRTPTPTNTATPTETHTFAPVSFEGTLARSTGLFTYGSSSGVAGADEECNTRFPGSHACQFSELLSAEASGQLVGITDINGMTVTSFWVIDPARPNNQQCFEVVRWNYATAHTGVGGARVTLNNTTGDLGTPTTGLNCGVLNWVGCCQ